MRKIFYLLIIIFFGCSKNDNSINNQTQYLSSNLHNGLIAFYPFYNSSINDFSGNSYNLINNNSATPSNDRFGNINNSYAFNKTNNNLLKFINATFLNNFNSENFTISLWFKRTDVTTNSSIETLIKREGDNPDSCLNYIGEWYIGIHSGRPTFGMNNNFRQSDNFQNNVWYHLVATKGSSGYLDVYLNGQLSIINLGASCQTKSNNSSNLIIGEGFTGNIDDILIYNRLLTQSEILELKNLPAYTN